MQGIKRKRRCQYQCEEHVFALKNLKNNSKYDIKLTFCPKYQRQPLPPQHTFAEFNNDGLFYTSAFALGVDKKIISKNLQKEMLDHQKLIKQNCEKYNQIVFPRPNSKHTTCSVCKQVYRNYYQHIFSDEHSEKIQLSPYNVFVKQLCQLFIDLWDGCAQKADNNALNQLQIEHSESNKKGSDELNLDDILEEEDIDSNPSRISKYLEEDGQQESQIKQVVMRKPVRVYEPSQIQKPQKVYEDRQSRKKNMNFAAFFDDEPKKKIINDHREPVNLPPKKSFKTQSLTQAKSKEKIPLKKQLQNQQTDPFIIEYNARNKRKEKKSYYYLKKKQRQEREQREKELLIKQQSEQGLTKSKNKVEQAQQQFSNHNQQENQNQIQKSSEEEYEKYLDQFHQNQAQIQHNQIQIKKKFSSDLKLFEEVQKKPFPAPLFESFASPIKNQEQIIAQKPYPISKESKFIPPEFNLALSELYSQKRLPQKESRLPVVVGKKMNIDNEQKQQICDKNKINYSQQNQLPLFHKFKNPLEKQAPKQNETKTHKASHQVFNEYEQKIRQYQKQKDYNAKLKISQKINPFQEKVRHEFSFDIQESTAKQLNKPYLDKDFEETYRYGEVDRNIVQSVHKTAQIKTQAYNTSKYSSYSDSYFRKPSAQKQLLNTLPLNPLLPQSPYTNPHQFYPPYNYPISPYGYPLHEPAKTQRPPLKYGQQRQNQQYQRGYYYGNWQHPYYMPTTPGSLLSSQSSEVEKTHKNLTNTQFNTNKNEAKSVIYSGYPTGYPGYSTTGFPGYYHTPGTPYSTTQRPQYPHPSPNMRVPTQPNTSININFPMYLGAPYHNPYQYQHNTQRYPGQQPANPSSSQYLPTNQPQAKPSGSQYGGYNSGAQNSLPPYAEYQEYKKRESDRRR